MQYGDSMGLSCDKLGPILYTEDEGEGFRVAQWRKQKKTYVWRNSTCNWSGARKRDTLDNSSLSL